MTSAQLFFSNEWLLSSWSLAETMRNSQSWMIGWCVPTPRACHGFGRVHRRHVCVVVECWVWSIQALIPLTCTLARMMGWNGLSAKRKDQPFRCSYITVHVVHKYLCIWMIHHCEDQNWTALCEGPIGEYLSTDIGYSDEPPRRYIWLGFQYPNYYDINHSEGWM